MLIKVEIASFAVDPSRNTPVIILKDANGSRSLAIPIGPLEASAIAIESLKVKPEKPLTIDLVKLVMEQMGGRLERVVIDDYADQSFSARLQINVSTKTILLECRSSDALALSVRCGTPIYVRESVFEKVNGGKTLSDKDKLRKTISSTDTLEFGRYILE
jgi:bifunctional DNase/RNase